MTLEWAVMIAVNESIISENAALLERCQQLEAERDAALRIGREMEREECAKVAEDTAVPWDGYEQGLAGQYLAAAIRAREVENDLR